MRAVVQRVSSASVVVDNQTVGRIDHGLLVYLGVAVDDGDDDLDHVVNKVAQLRIFNDPDMKMNLNVKQVDGACLVVSAFSTLGDARKGNRPSFVDAAEPQTAKATYERFVDALRGRGIHVETGRFREHMDVQSVNDGPICVLVDSKKQL